MKSINLNDNVSVRLTPAGEAVWADSWKQTSPEGVPKCIREGATVGSWVYFPLWKFMQIFGPAMYNGMHSPLFVENDVRFEG